MFLKLKNNIQCANEVDFQNYYVSRSKNDSSEARGTWRFSSIPPIDAKQKSKSQFRIVRENCPAVF